MKRLLVAALLCLAVGFTAVLGSTAVLSQGTDEQRDQVSVSYTWEQSDLLPNLTALVADSIEIRFDSPPFNYFEPTEVTTDGDGHILLIWDEGGKGGSPGWMVPASRIVFFVDRVRAFAVDAPARRDFDYGQKYHVELLVGSDGTAEVQIVSAEFVIRPCETSSTGWCRVAPQAGQPQPGIDIPECPTGTRLTKPGNGEALICK
jgi:hypothetical protein